MAPRKFPTSVSGCVAGLMIALSTATADETRPASVNAPRVAAVADDHVEQMKQGTALFKNRVRRILTDHCLDCHGGRSVKADFDLSTRESLMDSGFAAERAADSHLLQVIMHTAEPHMPLKAERLPDDSIDAVRRWLDFGAPYDRPLVEPKADGAAAGLQVTDADRNYRAFQKLQPTTVPAVDHIEWCRTPIDQFVLNRQEAVGLLPNAAADRRTLIRRATFDLLGLPATPDEVDAFVNDPADDDTAWLNVIDRLLASPHYGERQARHWMDIARFAESHGYEQDYDRPHAYHYRDFLIRAFNDDMPYRQFVRWQLAGDELAPENPQAMMATGFLGAGAFPTQLTEAEFESARYDELDDMVTTTGVAFLGLSLGCARCHDHKYDPVPSVDYYRLAANFTTTIRSEIEMDLQPEENNQRRQQWESDMAALQRQLADFEAQQLPTKFADWLKTYDPEKARPVWETLNVTRIEYAAGTKFESLHDGSWLAVGSAPEKDVLTITAHSRGSAACGLRLEALTHDSLPQKGPGRAANGNFALGDLQIAVTEDSSPVDIKLTGAAATHQQNADSLSVAASIDEDPVSGWAVDGGGIGSDQAAVFEFAEPISTAAAAQWTIRLTFNHPNPKHAVGRLRLSVSERADAPVIVGGETVDPQVREMLLKTKAHPDPQSKAWQAAQGWYAATLPEWRAIHDRLSSLRQRGPELKLTKVMVTSEGLPHMSHHADGRGFPHFYPKTYFLTRGDVHQKREEAAPGFLQVLTPHGAEESEWRLRSPDPNGRTSFRRASLANWMTDAERGAGALAARVIVNRLWQHHFGRGIVATPNDFGMSGDRPSHPDLLEWLAGDLVAHNWQLKRLHRLIMTSSVYRQSTEHDEARAAVDRENVLLWRWTPRRLEAEAIRDSLLAVSGKLDPAMYGPGTLDPNMTRRSIYFFIKRSQLVPMMMLFDWPEHLVSIGRRSNTTIAPQALMFLNSPQGRSYAQAFADRLPSESPEAAVSEAIRLAFARSPSAEEEATLIGFLRQQQAIYGGLNEQTETASFRAALTDLCQAVMSMNEFVYIE
ncbi:MAG: PSD1 domain-containing protein [Planctomycetaceae bacterium]|nr:PSD1 domain-containing protein [Planctomycetaceae bacterium]